MTAVIEYLDEMEIGVCLRFNRLGQTAWIQSGFRWVSRLGDGGFWVVMALLLLFIQGPSVLPWIVQMAATGAVGILIYKTLKRYLVRERPYVSHGAIRLGAAPLDRYSFPSGHTLHAVNFTILFGQVEPLLLLVALPFALLVAMSRVILGLHYPTDVLVGAAIGVTLSQVSSALA
ncbi:MAG TPA: phosphatase PAP2 family protein [Woeseiaceae bacterium]|nr:phosphatase PAP2 family protein [Woeseiaceae bacterium]